MNEKEPEIPPKIAPFTLAPELRKHVDNRCKRLGFKQAEYMRHLILEDKQKNPDKAA